MMNATRKSSRLELRLGLSDLSSHDRDDRQQSGFFTPAEVQFDEKDLIARKNDGRNDASSASELESLNPIEDEDDMDDLGDSEDASLGQPEGGSFVFHNEEQPHTSRPSGEWDPLDEAPEEQQVASGSGPASVLDKPMADARDPMALMSTMDVASAAGATPSFVHVPNGADAEKRQNDTGPSNADALMSPVGVSSGGPSSLDVSDSTRGTDGKELAQDDMGLPDEDGVLLSSSSSSSRHSTRRQTRRQRTVSSAGGHVLFSAGVVAPDNGDVEAADTENHFAVGASEKETPIETTQAASRAAPVEYPQAAPSSSVANEKRSKRSCYVTIGVACLVLLVVIIIAVVVGRGSGSTGTPVATSSPTRAPITPSPTPDDFEEFRKTYTPYSGEEALSDPSSPQYKAALWAAEEDGWGVAVDLTQKLQRYFLACLYFATNEYGSWTRCDRDDLGCVWGTAWLDGDVNECDWFGIDCDTEGRVNKISFDVGQDQKMGLEGQIPLELSYLTHLTQLSLSGNQLSGPIPTFLGKLTVLEQLRLGENQFKGTIPTELQKLSLLSWLGLELNQLTGTIPEFVGLYEGMSDCHLQGNQFFGLVPPFLLHISSSLDVSSNRLTGFADGPTWEDTRLGVLKASANLFDEKVWSQVLKSKGLTVLQLDENNQLGGSLPSELFSLSQLTTLDLSSCAIAGTIPSSISQLTALENLFLDDNQLDGPVPVDSLDSIAPSLRKVELQENELTGQISSGTSLCELRGDNENENISVLTADCSGGEVACDCCSACF